MPLVTVRIGTGGHQREFNITSSIGTPLGLSWLIKAETCCEGACEINTRGILLRMRYCHFIVFYSTYFS
jgi:hypothetical protein